MVDLCLLLRRKSLTLALRVDVVEGIYGPCYKYKALTLVISVSFLVFGQFHRCNRPSATVRWSLICTAHKQNEAVLHCFWFTLVIRIICHRRDFIVNGFTLLLKAGNL
jgi:hypothetical protein